MYQQPLTQTLTTEALCRCLDLPAPEERKMTGRDALIMMAQTLGGLVLCCGVQFAFG